MQNVTWRPHVTSSFCVFRISKNRTLIRCLPVSYFALLESQNLDENLLFQTEFVCHSPSVMFWCMLMLSRFDALFWKLFFSSSCLEVKMHKIDLFLTCLKGQENRIFSRSHVLLVFFLTSSLSGIVWQNHAHFLLRSAFRTYPTQCEKKTCGKFV